MPHNVVYPDYFFCIKKDKIREYGAERNLRTRTEEKYIKISRKI